MKKIVLYSLVCFALIGCGEGLLDNRGKSDNSEIQNPPSGGATGDNSQTFDAPAIEASVKEAYLIAINNARAVHQNCGSRGIKKAVAPLKWNDALYKAAYEHSEDLVKSDTFSHTGSGTPSDWTATVKELGRGSTFIERIENNGYTNYKTIGENITAATDRDTAQKAIDAWLESDGHCANIMNPKYTEIGMGHVEQEGTTYTHCWTQNFGAR